MSPSRTANTKPDTLPAADRFLNRELSWLEFNHRVLAESMREGTPLLERLKFLAISSGNLDEFFMVRVGGLMMQVMGRPNTTGIAGMKPAVQLAKIRERVLRMVADQYQSLDTLMPALAEAGIRRLPMSELSNRQMEHLEWQFQETISAISGPIAVRDASDFPSLIGAQLGICFRLRGESLESHIQRLGADETPQETSDRFVVIPLTRQTPRIMVVPSHEGLEFVMAEDVIISFADRLFGESTIVEAVPFRTRRNADVDVNLEVADDLLEGMQQVLERRNIADCVRLEVDSETSDFTLEFLQACLEIDEESTYRIPGPIDLSAWFEIAGHQGFPELRFDEWEPQPVPGYNSDVNIFDYVSEADRLLIHPYDSYDPVVDLIREAARDPGVLAIRQTLYRTARNSAVVAALQEAADAGKHVTVILELKARFDEKRNIDWARKLERSGVDVIYGVRGLKIHAKMLMILRREPTGVYRYLHLGTGNYNEQTARLYTDASLLTRSEVLGNDVSNLFNAITGLSIPRPMQMLSAAPIGMRERFCELIDVERVTAERGGKGVIRAKMNSLVDRQIIDKLYAASKAGVRIELNVRGICCLRPGVPGLSDNIRVVSIVDRLLEHMRVFDFWHGGNPQTFISSADWMDRNLDRRVELLVPVTDPELARRLRRILELCMRDNTRSHELQGDGEWHPAELAEGASPFNLQLALHEMACQRFRDDPTRSEAMETFRPQRSHD